MFIGSIVDIAIALVFTYLLLGLLASSCQELFVGVIKLRGRKLFNALDQVLADGLIATDPGSLAFQLKNHPLVKPLGSSEKPSYLPAQTFALALIDCLTRDSQAPLFSQVETSVAQLPVSPLRNSLTTYLKRAAGDMEELQTYIQTWFDDAMDRVSGDYKRFSHYFLLTFGFVIAVTLNIDSINIVNTLWAAPSSTRENIAQAASAIGTKSAASPVDGGSTEQAAANATAALQQLQALPLPIGWSDTAKSADSSGNPLTVVAHAVFFDGAKGVWRVLGWLFTAFGVSAGAPFWFNALQQLLNLRAAGPKPLRADAQQT